MLDRYSPKIYKHFGTSPDFADLEKDPEGAWVEVEDVLELLRLIHQTDQTPPYIMDQPVSAGYKPLDGSRFETPREITRKIIAQLTD